MVDVVLTLGVQRHGLPEKTIILVVIYFINNSGANYSFDGRLEPTGPWLT